MHAAALGPLVRYLGVHLAPLYPGEFGLDTEHTRAAKVKIAS